MGRRVETRTTCPLRLDFRSEIFALYTTSMLELITNFMGCIMAKSKEKDSKKGSPAAKKCAKCGKMHMGKCK